MEEEEIQSAEDFINEPITAEKLTPAVPTFPRITEATDVGEAINDALINPEKEKPRAGSCIGCGSTRVTMSVFMIATTRNVAPQVRRNTRAMSVCSECCNPESPSYASLGSILAVQVFSLRNVVFETVAKAWRERKGQ